MTHAENKNSSCILYIILFLVIFTINFGIVTYFVYFYWYLKKDDAHAMLDTCTETIIYWIYKWENSKNLTLKIKNIISLMTCLIQESFTQIS